VHGLVNQCDGRSPAFPASRVNTDRAWSRPGSALGVPAWFRQPGAPRDGKLALGILDTQSAGSRPAGWLAEVDGNAEDQGASVAGFPSWSHGGEHERPGLMRCFDHERIGGGCRPFKSILGSVEYHRRVRIKRCRRICANKPNAKYEHAPEKAPLLASSRWTASTLWQPARSYLVLQFRSSRHLAAYSRATSESKEH